MNCDFEDAGLKPPKGCGKYDYFDWYDYNAVEKLRGERAKTYIALVRKWHNAKEKNDEEAKKKAFKAMSKHKAEDEILKKKAENAGSYWY